MAFLLSLSLCLLLHYAQSTLPPFSWDTLPVFFHSSNQSGPYSSRAIEVISRYSMATIEKWQGYLEEDVDDEDAMVQAMIAIKKHNPKIGTYFYMNSFKDRPEMTRMARELKQHPDWMLKDSNGTAVKNGQGFYAFDLSQADVRDWWKQTCLDAVAKANGDGCFCDSSQRTDSEHTQGFHPPLNPDKLKQWEEGLLTLTKDVQEALGNDKLLIGKVPDQPYVKAVQIESFNPNNKSISDLMEGVKNKKVMQVHYPVGKNCDGDITDVLAAFLIGAGPYSYYGCGGWQAIGNSTEPLTWRKEYEQPLGEPLSQATYENSMWKREFSKGTKVTFDATTNKGTIHWGTK